MMEIFIIFLVVFAISYYLSLNFWEWVDRNWDYWFPSKFRFESLDLWQIWYKAIMKENYAKRPKKPKRGIRTLYQRLF